MVHLLVKRPGPVLLACLILILIAAACQKVSAGAPSNGEVQSALATQSASATKQSASAAAGSPSTAKPAASTATVLAPTVAAAAPVPANTFFLSTDSPQSLRNTLTLPAGWTLAPSAQSAALTLDLQTTAADPATLTWVYALVAPFPTVADDASLADLQQAWSKGLPDKTPYTALLVDPSTRALFTQLWGQPSSVVQTRAAAQLVDTAWAAKTAWAILPFEQVEPRWKVIRLDGQSPVEKSFDPAIYPLALHFALHGDPALQKDFLAQSNLPATNRRADHLTTVMVTGVTALVRGTASLMENRGMDYPATDIGDWLREADILHISNEVAFAPNCPVPYDWPTLVFCSRAKYLQLLKDVGADVIELSGDHFNDWGPEAVLYTLDLYRQAGIKYYGGGENIADARKPALFEHNGNRIGFVGCNAKPPGYAKAAENYPGALHCNMDQMDASVKQLVADGYAPIVTFQHLEYYAYTAHPILQKDFRQMADAGAVIVSGSQAHQPHAFEFKDQGFLHYGLGNLFFDQTNQGDPPRTAFIDRHVFYEGKHISTELLTIYFVDYARARPMTLAERAQLLKTVFAASGW